MAAGVLLRDDAGRVLLVEPTYKDYWELPGGAVEADESPYDGAVREVTEELGIVVTPGRILVVDWVPPRADRTEGLIVVYDGGMVEAGLAARIRLTGSELRSWAWSTLPEADTRLSPLLARRVRAAVQAANDHATTYLEDGFRRA
jgi:8-oxo-dGTP pyrophosphatase MutT (NUDIX family)